MSVPQPLTDALLREVAAAAGRLGDAGPLLLVCRSGKRSLDACQRLSAVGVTDVTNLAGGMLAWNEAGFPVAPGGAADGGRG